MTVVSANLAQLMTVELDHILHEDLENTRYEELLNAIFQVSESRKKYEYGLTVGGFSLAPEKAEGEDMIAKEFQEAYKTTYTHKTFAMYCPITLEARQDELHGIIDTIPNSMARGVDCTINYYAARIFSRANNTSEDFITGGDGVSLLSTAHPLRGGGTSANTPSSGVDLTVTAFWTEVTRFYQMLDDQSKPLRNRPDRLLIPEQYERKAVEILSSEKMPEDANNAINALRQRYNITPIIWPYWIGSVDPDCWFLLAAKDQWGRDSYPLRFYWRMRPTTDSYNDFLSKDFLYSIVMRFSLGYTDWRWVSGSMGA